LDTRLLIVDDDGRICLLLKQWLDAEGFVCQTVGGGAEALAMLSVQAFDAVISDLSMPGMSGLDLLVEVRQRYRHTAFLMATGVGDISSGIQAMKQGADDYLLKPFQLEAAVTSVQRALERRRLEREVENYRTHLEEMVRERTRQLYQVYDETLEALGAALDLKDGNTARHTRRVIHYCLEIARVMGFSDEDMQQLKWGACLHDIGKIATPDSILLKPAKLTPSETSVMWDHPSSGYELVDRVSFLSAAAQIVLTHHERYDGSGYPHKLKGDAIPLGARVFAVADALDAMTSDRPYRPALPFAVARDEIRRESGRQFDPRVVEAFFSLPEDTWVKLRENAEQDRSARIEAGAPLAQLFASGSSGS